MAGRKTIPTAIKIATGNPGKRALNKNEPGGDLDPEEIPLELIDNEAACDAYLFYARIFHRNGMLKDRYREHVIQIARFKARLLKQQKLLEAEQDECCIGKNGGGYINPRASLVTNLVKELRTMLADFGMNPASAAKLYATPPSAAGVVGKGYAEHKIKQMGTIDNKEDDWQPPIEVAG